MTSDLCVTDMASPSNSTSRSSLPKRVRKIPVNLSPEYVITPYFGLEMFKRDNKGSNSTLKAPLKKGSQALVPVKKRIRKLKAKSLPLETAAVSKIKQEKLMPELKLNEGEYEVESIVDHKKVLKNFSNPY